MFVTGILRDPIVVGVYRHGVLCFAMPVAVGTLFILILFVQVLQADNDET